MRAYLAAISLCIAVPACGDDEKKADIVDATAVDTTPVDTAQETVAETVAETTAETVAETTAETVAETTAETVEDTTPTDTVDPAEQIARGSYVLQHLVGCQDCHTPRLPDGSFNQTKWLAGIDCFVDINPANPDFGCISTANLTNHATGLMNRTDTQIKDMFMKGVRPDGKFLASFMPYWVFGNMKESDADAIVAYLRSITGVDHTVQANQAPWIDLPAAAPLVDPAILPMPRADYPEMEAAMRGRYIAVNIGPCLDCHTQSPEPGTSDLPRIWEKAFQGREAFPRDAFGLPPFLPEIIFSMNLTQHESGILGYTAQDIAKVLREGVAPDGKLVCPPMPAGPNGAYGGMTAEDALDVGHFIASLEGKENILPNMCAIDPAPPQ